jgi:hypothetical protein
MRDTRSLLRPDGAMGLLLTLAILRGAALGANSTSPVGRWQTVDDVTGKPRAIVRIAENGAC